MNLSSGKIARINGSRAEWVARNYFESVLGARIIAMTNGKGTDLTVDIGRVILRVEVKMACRQKSGAWKTSRVFDARQSDDLVAIVMPDDSVHLDTMADHLRACDRGGSRSVTCLVREYATECA